MSSLGQLSQIVKDHLIHSSCKWAVAESQLGGRGLIATADISTGEVLFVDRPLLYGPRAGTDLPRGCTVCHRLESDVFFKCSRCALLLCSEECQSTIRHYDDCSVISRWENKVPMEEVDDTIMSRALTVIRALLLEDDQFQFMNNLSGHEEPQHGFEVRHLKVYFNIPEEEEKKMLRTCYVLDTNAYQVASQYGKKEMDSKGLYPVASLLNSTCVPNTRYAFNKNREMVVVATKPIPAGTEIFTCYTGLLWGTPARQMYLRKTKHFLCRCDRCADPTERGTLLAALKCFSTECPGSLLPIEPLVSTSSWRCLECGMRVPSKNIFAVQNALGSMLATLNFKDVNDLEWFLLNRVTKFIPKTNQIVVDLKCRLVYGFEDVRYKVLQANGRHYMPEELTESRLALKESLCRDVLRVVAALGLGDAHQRGLLLYHLHATLAERARRCPDLYEVMNEPSTEQRILKDLSAYETLSHKKWELKAEIENTIEQAYKILQDDISAPADLELRRKYLGPGCDKTQEERFFILHK